MSLTTVLTEIALERKRQDAKWGRQDHPDGTGPDVLWADDPFDAAELARFYTARCQQRFARGAGTWSDVLLEEFAEAMAEVDPSLLRAELIQQAAVCAAWVEAIDRRGNGG